MNVSREVRSIIPPFLSMFFKDLTLGWIYKWFEVPEGSPRDGMAVRVMRSIRGKTEGANRRFAYRGAILFRWRFLKGPWANEGTEFGCGFSHYFSVNAVLKFSKL